MSLLGLIFSFILFSACTTAKASQTVRRGSPFRRRSPAGAARRRRDLSRTAVGRRGLLFVARSAASPDEMCERPFRRVTERRSEERRGSGERERRGRGNTRGNGLIKSWCVGRVVPRPRQHAVAHIMHVSMQTAVQNPNKSQPINAQNQQVSINQSPINQSKNNPTSYP